MKYIKFKNIFYLLIICMIGVYTSCEEDNFVSPKADFQLCKPNALGKLEPINEPLSTKIGETLTFKFTGTGTLVSFYTGEGLNNYDSIGISDKPARGTGFKEGEQFNRNLVYTIPGTYTFVCISTSYRNSDEKFARDMIKKQITVADTATIKTN